MTNVSKLTGAIKFALFVGTATMAASGLAFAQDQEQSDEQKETTTLDRIEVTGSRLKRADIEGAAPVLTIDRAQLDATGDVSVADVLRDTTFASFGNFKPQSGSSAQSLATIDLRGLGSGRTLVLIDGRRAPTNPMSASSGSDLNAIPMAAVERIEILTDGASAVYGSDAIGGVVNVILRKDFNGAELRYGIGQTEVKGGDTEEMSAVFGVSGERGRLIGGASASSRGMVFTRDQIGGDVRGGSLYGNNYYDYAIGTSTKDGSKFLTGTAKAVPGFDCTQGAFWGTKTAAGDDLCVFDFNSVAANEASVKNKSVFARGDYQINDDWTVYTNATVSKVETFGRYAPVPGVVVADDGTPNDINDPAVVAYMKANPAFADKYGVDAATLTTTDGLPTYFYHRFAAAGNRDNTTDTTNTDFLLGFQGNLTDSIGVDFGLRRTDYKYLELGRGYIVSAIANQFVNSGEYDLLDPYGADPAVLSGMTATISRESRWQTDELFASVNFDLFEMGGGMSNAVVGAEHREDKFSDLYDSLSEGGQVLGSAGNSSSGERTVSAAYFEWLLPFTSTFDVTLAGRYDRYSDYGNDFSPKIAMRWQPLDNLTFRGSYGEGFRAPGLDILNQKPSFSAEPARDEATCLALGQAASCQTQVDTYYIANPQLESEQSKQYSLGVVYDPFEWLNFSLDYYNIEVANTISSISAQDIINSDVDPATYGNIPAGMSIERNANGRITRIIAGYANEGTLSTEGYDLRAGTRFDLGDMGRLKNDLIVSYIDKFEIEDRTGLKINSAHYFGTPNTRINLLNSWAIGDFTVGWNVNYIGGQRNPAVRWPNGDYRRPGTSIGSYTTNDVQVSWKAPWNAQISVGATNVGNRYPELVAYDGRPWNFYLYDAYGRTTYLRYVQSF